MKIPLAQTPQGGIQLSGLSTLPPPRLNSVAVKHRPRCQASSCPSSSPPTCTGPEQPRNSPGRLLVVSCPWAWGVWGSGGSVYKNIGMVFRFPPWQLSQSQEVGKIQLSHLFAHKAAEPESFDKLQKYFSLLCSAL